MDVEIQQRAVEYSHIFGLDRDVRFALLEHMPILETAMQEETLKGTGQPLVEQTKSQKPSTASLLGTDVLLGTGKPSGTHNIMDLLGGLDLGGQGPAIASTVGVVKQPTTVDLLGDLFGNSPAVPSLNSTKMDPLTDLLRGPISQPIQASAPTFAAVPCYEKNGLKVTLYPLKESSTITQFKANFTSQSEVTNLLFQVAVPKVLFILLRLLNLRCKLQVETLSIQQRK
jgi:AP-1 complex subunit gamma-1